MYPSAVFVQSYRGQLAKSVKVCCIYVICIYRVVWDSRSERGVELGDETLRNPELFEISIFSNSSLMNVHRSASKSLDELFQITGRGRRSFPPSPLSHIGSHVPSSFSLLPFTSPILKHLKQPHSYTHNGLSTPFTQTRPFSLSSRLFVKFSPQRSFLGLILTLFSSSLVAVGAGVVGSIGFGLHILSSQARPKSSIISG